MTAPRTTNGGRIEEYVVKCSLGLGNISWPTGFRGTGWAVLNPDGSVSSRHAFRFDALAALIRLDGLDVAVEDIAGDVA